MGAKTGFVAMLMLVVGSFVVTGCTGTSSPPAAPGPTSASSSAPTTAPVVGVTSTAPTAAAATAAPTQAPSATPKGGMPSAASVVPQAMAKTRAAAVFKSSHVVNLSPAFGAQYDSMRMFYAKGEFNGKDAHLTIGGYVLAPINPKTVDEIQVYRVGGKTYIHGPAAAVGAPDNKWYVLPGDFVINGAVDTFNVLDQLIKFSLDWSAFKYNGSSNTGSLKCDQYTAGKDVVTTMPPLVWLAGSNLPATPIDDGELSFSACNNGYLSQIEIKLQGHDSANPDAQGTAEFSQSFSDYDTNSVIAAPTGAVPASKPTTPFALGMPTPYVSAPKAPAAAAYDGLWAGKSSDDSVIQFVVEKNQFTNASLNYSVLNSASERPAGCPLGDGGAHAGSVSPTPINGSTFTLSMPGGGQTQLTFTGTFKSATTAEGTMHLKGVLPFCNKPYETDVTWKATKQGSVSATPVATTKPAVALPTMTPAVSYQSVVDAFFQAVNTKNVDAALAMAEDQVFFQIGSTNGIGKENLKTYLTALTASGTTITASGYKPLGSTNVDFSVQVSDGTVFKRCDVGISYRGKLQTLTCFAQ